MSIAPSNNPSSTDHHDPQGDADMRRGDPDAGRGVHRLDQVICEFSQRLVERGAGSGRDLEPAIWIPCARL